MRISLSQVVLTVFLLVFSSNTMAADSHGEYQLKAEISYKVAKFVTWPEDTFAAAGEPFIICVLGEKHAEQGFDLLEGRSINGHRVLLRYHESWQECQGGHLIYISADYVDQLDPILRYFGDRPVLTVSDMNGFATKGGMINLTGKNKAVRFVINLSSVHKAGLTVSSKLNTLAAQVIREMN